jgi:hypothetical protein
MSTNSKIKINLDSLKSRREWKRHKVKDGHNVFRILPPFGEASNGYPYRKWQIIWGLADPETGRMRPFASSMTSEKKCPVTEYVAALKKKADNMKAKLLAGGASEDEVKNSLKDLNELISNLNPKTVYIYNAADKAGEVGLLELKSTAHKKMKTLMNQYVNEYNQDPTSLNSADDDSGVWFDITRQGLGRDTEYDVIKCQTRTKAPSGKVTFEDDRSPLPDSVVENYDNLAYDLTAVYQLKTYEELDAILKANMPTLVEMVPDAALDGASTVAAPAASTAAKPLGKKPVSLKLDDGDDDVDSGTANKSTPMAAIPSTVVGAKKTVAAVADDDFMSAADALLNG